MLNKKLLPDKNYYAVIFISERSDDLEGYADMDVLTIDLAQQIKGFIGFENIKTGNKGIFISYWQNLDSINQWKDNQVHLAAKQKGFAQWYNSIISQICKIEHTRVFERNNA
jgi:heme-degrading monooxygenase HmoA